MHGDKTAKNPWRQMGNNAWRQNGNNAWQKKTHGDKWATTLGDKTAKKNMETNGQQRKKNMGKNLENFV